MAHITLNVVGIVCIIAGFIVSIIMVDRDFKQADKLALIHSWLGLASIIMGCVFQPLIGWWSNKTYKPERERVNSLY